MLEPNLIPDTEPLLNVGIVLPEDRYSIVEIITPDMETYRLQAGSADFLTLEKDQSLDFELKDGLIHLFLDDEFAGRSDFWKIEPVDLVNTITKKSGLKIRSVTAGRGFHWVKKIDVYLPGTVEIRIVEGNLLVSNVLPMEQYLVCVATSEMSAACPTSLIESQIIIARSWMLANIEMKHASLGLDVCNDDCCQRYQGTTFLNDDVIQSASNTLGKVLMFDDKICDTRYSKCCGGVTEAFENVFGDRPIQYLKSLVDAPKKYSDPSLPLISEKSVRQWIEKSPKTYCNLQHISQGELISYLGNVDEDGEYFRWRIRYTQKEITALLNLKLDLDAQAILAIRPMRRGASGRLIKIAIDYRMIDGNRETRYVEDQYIIRQTLHAVFLYSSAFVIDNEKGAGEIPSAFILKGAGWGHGVGYCQIGALGMALQDHGTEEILSHYYPDSELEKIY